MERGGARLDTSAARPDHHQTALPSLPMRIGPHRTGLALGLALIQATARAQEVEPTTAPLLDDAERGGALRPATRLRGEPTARAAHDVIPPHLRRDRSQPVSRRGR